MPITFHMLEAGAKATPGMRTEILAAFQSAAETAQAMLPPFNVDVIIFEDARAVIPRIGVNGNGYHAHKIDLIYDSEHPHFRKHLAEECGALIVHELHHHARPDYGWSLGERIVSEGPACAFEVECGFPTPCYAVECKGEALQSFGARALPMLPRKNLKFDDWMFGRMGKNDDEFPYQCGYSLGYAIVRAWLHEARTTAAKSFDVKADLMLDAWRSGAIKPFST